MGKAIRRASVAALAAATSAVMVAGTAFAAPSDSYKDDYDRLHSQYNFDNNLDDLFRVAGVDRISTAIQLMESNEKWDNEQRNRTVIVASADKYADALASGPLADVYDAPVLLSHEGAIDGRVLDAIDRKGFENVILVGGTGVFPASAMQQLEGVVGVGDVQQVGGLDRYETAVDIAQHVGWRVGGGLFNGTGGVTPWHVNVYLATGTEFPDALSSGAAAADNDGVVLLTKGETVPKATRDFLEQRSGWNSIFGQAVFNSSELYTVGGAAERAVEADGIENVVASYTGTDRYDTAAIVAENFHHDIETLVIASGEGFADGVAGGAFAANRDGALLLTKHATLTNRTTKYLKDFQIDSPLSGTEVVVIGGDGSVSKNVSAQLTDLFTK